MPSGLGVFPSFNIFSALRISAIEGGFNNMSASLVTGSCQLLRMLVIGAF